MARIRPATEHDYESIVPWTKDTFEWGDYVGHRFHRWLSDPEGELLVSVDDDDTPTAMANVALLSAREAWLEAARVHPDHRRQGLGSALNHAGVDWARARGALVARLAIETANSAANNQVSGLGYRPVSRWLYQALDIDPTYRCEEHFRLRPALGLDAETGWMAWSASDFSREVRGMVPLGWRWRMATLADVSEASASGRLFHSAAGWVEIVSHDDRWLETRFMATAPRDVLGLIDGLRDYGAAQKAGELSVKLPDVAWAKEALIRSGGDPNPVVVWEKPI